ncbi:MAG: hypothetical protein OXR73_03315 [Myxococcales bacterium]|nr:hypothetical protein [Myxococcales bacterium]
MGCAKAVEDDSASGLSTASAAGERPTVSSGPGREYHGELVIGGEHFTFSSSFPDSLLELVSVYSPVDGRQSVRLEGGINTGKRVFSFQISVPDALSDLGDLTTILGDTRDGDHLIVQGKELVSQTGFFSVERAGPEGAIAVTITEVELARMSDGELVDTKLSELAVRGPLLISCYAPQGQVDHSQQGDGDSVPQEGQETATLSRVREPSQVPECSRVVGYGAPFQH